MGKEDLVRMLGMLDLLTPELQSLIDQLALLGTITVLIFSLLQCFFGYRLLRWWIRLIGFLIGFVISFGFVSYQWNYISLVIRLLIGIAGGILVGYLAFRLYLVGVFLLGGAAAAAAVTVGIFGERQPVTWEWIVIGIVFLAAGILCVKFQRTAIILFTSISGGIQAVNALKQLVPEIRGSAINANITLAALIVLGLLMQFMMTREKSRRK